MKIIRVLIPFICLVITFNSYSQITSVLYQDSYIKASFKQIDHQYGYILEEYGNSFGGTVVSYTVEDDIFLIKELDSPVILDSMIFYESSTYKKDSVMLSLRFRINEFTNGQIGGLNLRYIINDTIQFESGKMYLNDDFHRALIPKMQLPYKLEIKSGHRTIGPFTITSQNDICCKIVILTSTHFEEFDAGKLLPKTILFEGEKYRLEHSFIPWD